MESINWAALSFIGGGFFTGLTILIRDIVQKNTFKHKLAVLELAEEARKSIDLRQDADIKKAETDLLIVRERQFALAEHFEKFQENQREESKIISKNLNDLNQSFASLDATLKGIKTWLENVSKKMDQKADRKRL